LLPRVWIVLRFVVFGVFGFLVMCFAFVALADQLTSIHREKGYFVPLGLIALGGLGALMMLFGVGEWGRWHFLFVFLSIPTSMSVLFLFPHGGKDLGVIVPALASVGTYVAVRAYYARRKRTGSSEHF